MTTYKVLSDNFSLAAQGENIADTDLEGFNVDALVEGGHLTKVNDKVSKQVSSETDK